MPKVSICIPTYNQATLLKKVLKSIVEQTFTDYELIISDDTLDNSIEVVLNEFNFGTQLNYIHHTPSLGSPANWNYALKQAKGEYIKIVHHDDYFINPDSLAQFVHLLDSNPRASFGFSATKIDLLQLNMIKYHHCSVKHFNLIKNNPEALFFSNVIGAPSATIIRNKFNILFDEQLKWLVDVDWYIRIIKQNNNLAYSSKPLICTIHGAEGQTTQEVITEKDLQICEHIVVFSKIFSQDLNLKKYALFFQILFNKFKVNSLQELNTIVTINNDFVPFFENVFNKKNHFKFFKKVVYWTKKSSFKDIIFTLQTKLK
jgi:glycosyltransferase involved in cell wall biosynthesis